MPPDSVHAKGVEDRGRATDTTRGRGRDWDRSVAAALDQAQSQVWSLIPCGDTHPLPGPRPQPPALSMPAPSPQHARLNRTSARADSEQYVTQGTTRGLRHSLEQAVPKHLRRQRRQTVYVGLARLVSGYGPSLESKVKGSNIEAYASWLGLRAGST